ncbi:MAG: DMT family transporter [Chloroflexi bacterium]|nr:DMT family transporter [Chloroflexota bacterium]
MKRQTASSPSGLHLRLGKGELWALVAALAYALNNIFVRVAVRDYDLNYMMGVGLRATPTFLFALLMGIGAKRRNPRSVSPISNWRLTAMLVGYGLLTFVIANPLLFAALRAGGVLVASPVTGTQALWAALIAALFLREPLNRTMIGGMVVTVAGIALLAVSQSGGTPVSPTWWLAMPFALGTAFCWALSGVLVTGAMRRGVDRFWALAVATGSGIVALNLYLLFTGDIGVYATTPLPAQVSLLLAGLLNTVALVSITTALSLTSVASATTLNSLQIGLAPLFAWLFLGEQLGSLMAAGVLLICVGVIVVQRAHSERGEDSR